MVDEARSPEIELYYASLKVEFRQKGLCAVIGKEDEEGDLSETSGQILCLYYDNELPDDFKKIIDEHLEGCYKCSEIYQRHLKDYDEISRMVANSPGAEEIIKRAMEWLVQEETEKLIKRMQRKIDKQSKDKKE